MGRFRLYGLDSPGNNKTKALTFHCNWPRIRIKSKVGIIPLYKTPKNIPILTDPTKSSTNKMLDRNEKSFHHLHKQMNFSSYSRLKPHFTSKLNRPLLIQGFIPFRRLQSVPLIDWDRVVRQVLYWHSEELALNSCIFRESISSECVCARIPKIIIFGNLVTLKWRTMMDGGTIACFFCKIFL